MRVDHPVVTGIVNVTPDSFSDGGRFADVDAAVAHGISLHRQGADIIDVGGESTRPGADRVDPATEIARVVPVIGRLAEAGVPMSIDTTRAVVAKAALTAGATVINDVSGGLADPDMAGVAAEAGCPWILMHWRGRSTRSSLQGVTGAPAMADKTRTRDRPDSCTPRAMKAAPASRPGSMSRAVRMGQAIDDGGSAADAGRPAGGGCGRGPGVGVPAIVAAGMSGPIPP